MSRSRHVEPSLHRKSRSISFRVMSLLRIPILSGLLCGLLMAGCHVGSTVHIDEQKEPYFLAGKNRLQERDYQGAVEMFEKALDVNPRSAAAHFELGVLYEQQQMDYPAALYHYQRTVMLNSNMPFAELARQRMQECKRELAKSVVNPISMAALQQEVEKLRVENQYLKQQLQHWQNFYAERGTAVSNIIQTATNSVLHATQSIANVRSVTNGSRAQTNLSARASFPITSNRMHKIASGDTLAAIARRYNVKLSALQSANPTMDARRLRPGQMLVIPPP